MQAKIEAWLNSLSTAGKVIFVIVWGLVLLVGAYWFGKLSGGFGRL